MQLTQVSSVDELVALEKAGKLNGLFDVPIDVYHGGPGLSSTGLKELLTSPAHFRAYMSGDTDTEALRQGRIAHLAILEPERYAAEVIVEPDIDRRTKDGKAAYADFIATAAGKVVVSAKDHELATALRQSILQNELANAVLNGGHAEVSCYWTDDATGLLCRARADYLNKGIIFDLKTTTNAAYKSFQRASESYLYHLSAAFYLDGFRKVLGNDVRSFGWVAIEKQAPHAIAFYAADDALLETGRQEYQAALTAFCECQTKEIWPGYPQEFQTLGLSPFYGR